MTASPTANRLGYRPELDGVRGLAVLCIFWYHISFYWAPDPLKGHGGGFLSVNVFFVLSGMLITEILLADVDRLGKVNLRSFFRRRARRLLPALLSFMAIAVVWYEAVHGTGVHILKGFASIITYVTTGHDATSVLPNPPGVGQIWTLVVEWTFYLSWPFILILLLRRGWSRRTIGCAILASAVLIGVVRAVAYHHQPNFTLSYHLAWLRFTDFFAGCGVGLLSTRPRLPSVVRTAGLAFLVFATGWAAIYSTWVYLYGMLLAALATAMIVQPRDQRWWFDRVLAWPPVVWIGTVSYSFYLWSVFTVSEIAHNLSDWPTAAQIALATAVSFMLAWASYTYIEDPLRVRSRRTQEPLTTGGRSPATS